MKINVYTYQDITDPDTPITVIYSFSLTHIKNKPLWQTRYVLEIVDPNNLQEIYTAMCQLHGDRIKIALDSRLLDQEFTR